MVIKLQMVITMVQAECTLFYSIVVAVMEMFPLFHFCFMPSPFLLLFKSSRKLSVF